MTLNRRLKIVAVFILIIPLIALFITGMSFFITWNLGWKESEDLAVPRFLHEPLLNVLRGEEISDSRFTGIILVLDHRGKVLFTGPRGRDIINAGGWNTLEEAYTEIMQNLPDFPLNISVYNYKGKSGLVLYMEQFFLGRKLFRGSALLLFAMYFGLIVLPILILSASSRPIIRSLMMLENAVQEIGKGNLDSPVRIGSKDGVQKRSLPEIRSLFNAIDQMRIELKENHDTQGRIMMAISHDLKTPLTLIKGYVEALKDGMAKSPEDVADYAGVIYDRSMLLEERINDLIYFARLRTSDWQARFAEFSLGELLDETAAIFQNDSLIRNRRFTYSSELSADVMITGDRKLLFQVFENLFDNACRYTDRDDQIRIAAKLSQDGCEILFEDSGSGISEEHREHIFASFYRADSGRNTRGIGVGLTSAKTIIESHGGTIGYIPSDLGGAGFILKLPVRGI